MPKSFQQVFKNERADVLVDNGRGSHDTKTLEISVDEPKVFKQASTLGALRMFAEFLSTKVTAANVILTTTMLDEINDAADDFGSTHGVRIRVVLK